MKNYSYTVLVAEAFEAEMRAQARSFLDRLLAEISERKIGLDAAAIDHLCWRTETVPEYESLKREFAGFARLLGENLIGGRRIAAFKLSEPIVYKGASVSVIELPEPKPGSGYPSGFEHAEFVVSESFADFKRARPGLAFDESGAMKDSNPELRVRLGGGISLKIHAQPLEQVILEEAVPACKNCLRPLAPGEGRAVPRLARSFAVLGFAIAHLGAIVGMELSGRFCPACRSRLTLRYCSAAAGLMAAALASAALLIGLIFG